MRPWTVALATWCIGLMLPSPDLSYVGTKTASKDADERELDCLRYRSTWQRRAADEGCRDPMEL